jgi:hypothetical protein
MGEQPDRKPTPQDAPSPELVAFSNGIRLTGPEWIVVGIFTVLLVIFAPILWKQKEPLSYEADHRMPHELGNDYWLYERYAEKAVPQFDTLLIGDSVIWGEYVHRNQTLSHYLNERTGQSHFANLGLDGAHPLALTGLVEHYAGSVRGKKVVLQCNPLWMSSLRADLQDDKATEFNHPRLVPQFVPWIPAYKKEHWSPRLGTLVEWHVPLFKWTNHLQQAYYDQSDIPTWTLEHPYANPLTPVTHDLPADSDSLRHTPQPWYRSGIKEQDYPWVELGSSLQWPAFQHVVKTLQQRGNHVFVLVGPFNEHLLSEKSRRRYQHVKATITDWLRDQQIPHLAPVPLPSDQYGDASHPLAGGYDMLARQLLNEPFFQSATGR